MPRHPFLTGLPSPRVLAHRGLTTPDMAADGIVENSRAAIEAAIAAGADIVESDCWITRDGAPILWHDPSLERVLGDSRQVGEATRSELAAMMRDRGGLITLEDALADFPTARFNLDAKTRAVAEPLGRLIAPHGARVLVTSFSDRRRKAALRAAVSPAHPMPSAASPGIGGVARILIGTRLGIASRRGSRAFRGIDAMQIPERQGPIRVLSPSLIAAAHRHGVEVHVWTVNDRAEMRRLVSLGVDGIVTDRADIALEALGRR